jgi:hypothetical protein
MVTLGVKLGKLLPKGFSLMRQCLAGPITVICGTFRQQASGMPCTVSGLRFSALAIGFLGLNDLRAWPV